MLDIILYNNSCLYTRRYFKNLHSCKAQFAVNHATQFCAVSFDMQRDGNPFSKDSITKSLGKHWSAVHLSLNKEQAEDGGGGEGGRCGSENEGLHKTNHYSSFHKRAHEQS